MEDHEIRVLGDSYITNRSHCIHQENLGLLIAEETEGGDDGLTRGIIQIPGINIAFKASHPDTADLPVSPRTRRAVPLPVSQSVCFLIPGTFTARGLRRKYVTLF